MAIYERAKQWGVTISYSAYTPLRTRSMDHYIQSPDDLALLRHTLDHLLALKVQEWPHRQLSLDAFGHPRFLPRRNRAGMQRGAAVYGGDAHRRPASVLDV